jgi:hypothetical protein
MTAVVPATSKTKRPSLPVVMLGSTPMMAWNLRIDVLNLPDLDPYAFWITFIGCALLAAGAGFRGI